MERMLRDLRSDIEMKSNITDNEFDSFVRRAAVTVTTGKELDWNFRNSFDFVFAAITTIGYGYITPKTSLGQGITIVTCLFGIPISMLAFKTAGELISSLLRYLIIKAETVLLKRGEPKHVKKKTFLAASALAVALHISFATSSTYREGWSFITSLYAWFTTFTTIGFGDYVPFVAPQIKLDQEKASEDAMIVPSLIAVIPWMVGFSVTSCLLNCIVDSLDDIRDFRNDYFSCWSNLVSKMKMLLCGGCKSYSMTEGRGEDHHSSHENNQVASL
ncbi:Potassium channel subfamily K member 3 [Stylophora pistillata]|uniref:Potassium channel subfamily K member 3 n=2 Tax=Stylophora pistillata TaxID=50429 RepID=A0A2B4S187_STYPI|nr:Potassium channel subfamily K member 3 [Stylophora pistillata]